MTEVLTDFIRALRAGDLRISTAESIEAGAALALVGYDDRVLLCDALSQVLAKTEDDKRTFGETFDRFFAFDQFTAPGGGQAEDGEAPPPGEMEDKQPSQTEAAPGDSAADGAPGGEGGAGRQSGLVELIESGDQARLQMALAETARGANLNQIRFFMQRGQYVFRIMERMGLGELDRTIADGRRGNDPEGQVRAERLAEAREKLRLEVRDYVEKQLKLFTANAGRRMREETLSQIRLSNLDHSDMKIMRELVRKMAKRLVALHSRRRKVDRRGALDVRRTIRANVEYDGLMFHTVWKRTRIDRPKVMAVCDVSSSVAPVARFLLMFLYSVQEVLPQVRSFAFSNRLGEVTELFERLDAEAALTETLRLCGGGGTDYGRAFEDLEALALDDIDHRTTVLILGDARSNFLDPRADILHKVHERARRVLFLNPERPLQWNTGDSVMRKLSPHCDRALTCASLRDLQRVVSDLMRTAV
jgi:hypothetical protein